MVNEKRLIDATRLRFEANRFFRNDSKVQDDVDSLICMMPTVDAVEVVHGRWEKHGKHDWRCSVCKRGVPYSFTGHAYCHNCGAKMGGTSNVPREDTEIDFDYAAED